MYMILGLGFMAILEKVLLACHTNNFKIPRQKYSTNMATGSYVKSRANDLYIYTYISIYIKETEREDLNFASFLVPFSSFS